MKKFKNIVAWSILVIMLMGVLTFIFIVINEELPILLSILLAYIGYPLLTLGVGQLISWIVKTITDNEEK